MSISRHNITTHGKFTAAAKLAMYYLASQRDGLSKAVEFSPLDPSRNCKFALYVTATRIS
jgi:hypothetical protein